MITNTSINPDCALDFPSLFATSALENWDNVAITNWDDGKNITYGDMINNIHFLHLLWQDYGLKEGDKIAIWANNSNEWITYFLAIVSSGFVAVIIPSSLETKETVKFISHSGCKILYSDRPVPLNGGCPELDAIIEISSQVVTYSSNNYFRCGKNQFFSKEGILSVSISKEEVSFPEHSIDNPAAIFYSSGTSGDPKAIAHSFRSATIKMNELIERFPHRKGDCAICIFPFSHVFGIVADGIASLCTGMSIVIIKNLSPSYLCTVFQTFKPRKLMAPPFILLSLISYSTGIDLSSDSGINELYGCRGNVDYCSELINKINCCFGNQLEAFITGGAALNEALEDILVNHLHFPLVSLYGSTETGAVAYGIVGKYKPRSCGVVVNMQQIRIISQNPSLIPGEIQIKTGRLFTGYFKNPGATKAAFTEDGWFKTGDLGYIDEEGNLFVVGRCKDMLLISNGENIYPEDSETVMNASSYIKESILVQRGEKLHAIVVPDREKAEADGLDAQGLNKKIDEAVREASKKLPGFTIISGFELHDEPLERTPKGSLMRYLYSDGIKEN